MAQGNYTKPKPKIGNIESHNPLDLLCLDFTKIDKSRTGKENVLVMTDAFSKFSVAVVTPNQKATTVAKALVDKWFYTYGIPTRIHSDQGKSFDNDIIKSLCKLYGVSQSLTCPYNPRGNAICERFNRTMFGLLRTLSKEQKAEWPVHLPSLVFAYNATPHSTTGLQPYQLMFGRKAPAPCDKWLGLGEYNDNRSASKAQWVDEQSERVRAANKRAMKKIKAATAKNRKVVGGKDLDIPPGNLVLIRDHPEGRNKIQDQNKPDLYVVVSRGERPN
ncbi:MAG: transposase family protein, partial [Proteobacteria bacterium]|nr:transposase family protein [Pseudomonadota bacterium]